MNPEQAAEALLSAGITVRSMTQVGGGWDSWTFEADGVGMIRFARNEIIATSFERERRLLSELAPAMNFQVPRCEAIDQHNGRVFTIHRKIPGRPLRDGDDAGAVASMVSEIHHFPVERARKLLGTKGSLATWKSRYEDLRNRVIELVAPVLADDLGVHLITAMDTFLEGSSSWDFSPVLVHNDLGSDHILIDPSTGKPVGMIDFGDATVGDPAIDYVGLWITCGEQETRRAISKGSEPVSFDRLRFYWRMGSVHAIIYGLQEGDDGIITAGIDGLRRRLSAGSVS